MLLRLRPIVVIFMALALLAALPAFSRAASYSVPGNYPTIGAAIANASPGDVITVDSGTYNENVVVDKPITLIGDDTGKGLPGINASGTGIDVSASGAVVQGFRVAGAATGISVHDCQNARIVGCIAFNDNDGILLTGTTGDIIMKNTVSENHDIGISVVNSNGNSLYLNLVNGNQYGVVVTGSSANNVVYMNAFEGNAGGNALANGLFNNWNSSLPVTYGYGGRMFSEFLGNYWDDLKGTDSVGDGILDSTVMLAGNNGDYNPLAVVPLGDPQANFSSDSVSGPAPWPVQFTDASPGYVLSWQWDFGDGNTSQLQDPPHIYSNNGQYTVSLTVTNAYGQGQIIRSNYITVGPASTPAPTASATPAITVTPSPWPTAAPTIMPTSTPTPVPTAVPTAKPSSPGMGPVLTVIALGFTGLFLLKRK